jgi:nucleoside-diphosphate-sugar epimerase
MPRKAPDQSPSAYIVRVDRATRREIRGPIAPEELLVHAHRDNHPLEIAVQFAASRILQVTGNEALVKKGLKTVRQVGSGAATLVGWAAGSASVETRMRRLLAVDGRNFEFQFREPTHLSDAAIKARIAELQREAREALRARGRSPRLRVLLTGATGFVGKEILAQAAGHPAIAEVVCVVRPETVRDRKTGAVLKVLSPAQRGALLLKRLHVNGKAARKFRFVAGDVEEPRFGLAAAEVDRLSRVLTHVVHCAASVSFDDPYDKSFRANVLGCRNALDFSLGIQKAKGSKFVSHVAIETSYIHGRRKRVVAQEGALRFPAHFYNNFYELTKAMASIETDRAMVERGLRVTQLLPSIVIGDSRTGNNRGDTKVVNAPINAFGRAKEALESLRGDLAARVKTWAVGWLATSFPADRSAELNLVPVDRVAAGILAALTRPEAIGSRIHLATDHRIRTEQVVRITREELGVNVRLADPTLARNVTLPVVKAVLRQLGENRLADVLERLGSIFGVYGEWGQPIHDVGNDVRILGLPIRRPHTGRSFRMLCRHNRFVQEFGRVREGDEVARRERLWSEAIASMEFDTGREAASLPPEEFQRLLTERIDLPGFAPRGQGRILRREPQSGKGASA